MIPRSPELSVGALSLIVGVIAAVLGYRALLHAPDSGGSFSLWLGSSVNRARVLPTFDSVVLQLGHGLFPWSAVAIFALARPLIRLDDEAAGGGGGAAAPRTNSRLAFGQLFVFFAAGLGFALSAYLVLVHSQRKSGIRSGTVP